MVGLQYTQPAKLSQVDWTQIRKFCQQFVDRDFDQFIDQLQNMDEIFLSRTHSQGMINAVGAVKFVQVRVGGRQIGLIYTPWTAIAPEVRGKNIVQRAGLRYFFKYRLKHPLRPIYWLYTAATYYSYLLLSRNFADYWPHPDRPTPLEMTHLLDQVMPDLGGKTWDPKARLLVRRGAMRYREGIVTKQVKDQLPSPDIQFYAQRNPRQAEGDALVCLCPLTAKNWGYLMVKLMRRLVRKMVIKQQRADVRRTQKVVT